MIEMAKIEEVKELLLVAFEATNGPLLHGDSLWKALGYSSNGAMRTALSRETTPIVLMEFPHREGKFALCTDVVDWIFEQRCKNSPEKLSLKIVDPITNDQIISYVNKYGVLLHEEEIMSILKIGTRKELLSQYKKNTLPVSVFQIDNRRAKLFALLPEMLNYIFQHE